MRLIRNAVRRRGCATRFQVRAGILAKTVEPIPAPQKRGGVYGFTNYRKLAWPYRSLTSVHTQLCGIFYISSYFWHFLHYFASWHLSDHITNRVALSIVWFKFGGKSTWHLKIKAVPVSAIKVYRGSRGTVTHIPNHLSRRKIMISLTPAA